MRRGHPEAQIQAACADYLERVLDPTLSYYTAIGHGGGGVVRGRLLKRMGMKRGVGDMLVCWRDEDQSYRYPQIGWLEIKAGKTGKQSPEQRDFASRMRWLYHRYAVVRSLDELIATLTEWGVPTKAKARRAAA